MGSTPVLMEFHVARTARDYYQFDQAIFTYSGNVIFANFHAARVFAQKMNARRDLVRFPEQAVRASQVNAMGLIDEILHVVMAAYRRQRNPSVWSQALDWMDSQVGREATDLALRQFCQDFPPAAVYQRRIDLDEYLAGESTLPDGTAMPNRQIVMEELLMLWLANMNPAFSPYIELFDDSSLEKGSAYPKIISSLQDFFKTQPGFGAGEQSLIDMLRLPALAAPHSLEGQLEFIRTRWSGLLGKYLYRLLSSLDLIKEEEKVIFGAGGPGPAVVYEFGGLEGDPERFSPDRDWMPNLVLIAKNSYVWLDQLSKKYRRAITRLDEIPDEELETLARWGFTGLWLIGLWERSQASRTIKQLRGNPEAVASAYSLFSYEIAADLGGEQAYRALRDRAWKRGIRLASDMVPNHMGIDSRWVIEHPAWFVALDYPPFPSYTFNGPDLSWDERVGLYIEDHYFTNTDAAVVFKRKDFWTGDEKYIYHGNDGTSMPWNDTAQLNYLLPEVREAVIQTILEVARKFPIIRFDAAMTLAKKHYQRLWFPEPGTGGAIPSRAEFGLTKEQFDAAFPEEFWRQVVDRVAQEAPDTLLLAEAFWLMEGYFVRTLGMHRVYNSAFMNMLRDEKNQEYRLVIKNTIEFEPEILKRYVNFMNNPDERTAVDQFGKGDKYMGIATLMATMPGLPMFGHGQVEGFTEKYGMEYRRAYWDEHPDSQLVERHERELFPLLRRRYLFAEVNDFWLYDFYTPEGQVNEDVFAYSNHVGGERSLVLYHNRFATARGWIHWSAASLARVGDDQKALTQKSLGEGLAVHYDPNWFTIFRDQVTGLEFIRNSQELHEQGLYAELNAYQRHVFLDFREVEDNEWHQYAHLVDYLAGRGVPSIDEAIKEIFLEPIRGPYRELVNADFFQALIDARVPAGGPAESEREGELAMEAGAPAETAPSEQDRVLNEAEEKMRALLAGIRRLMGGEGDEMAVAHRVRQELAAVLALPALAQDFPEEAGPQLTAAGQYLLDGPGETFVRETEEPLIWGVLFSWIFTHSLGKILLPESEQAAATGEQSRAWLDEWLLVKIIAGALQDLGISESKAWRGAGTVRILLGCQDWCPRQPEGKDAAYQVLQAWLQDGEVQRFLGINRYQGLLWFNKEAFDELLWWLFAQRAVGLAAQPKANFAAGLPACYALIQKLLQAEEKSNFQIERLLEASKG